MHQVMRVAGPRRLRRWAGLLLAVLVIVGSPAMAADYVIYDADANTDTGLDNPSAAMPIGGNDGTTLGEQRLIALRYAVRIVLSRLSSPVPIRIRASFIEDGSQGLTCETNSATLGFGGADQYVIGFDGAPRNDVLYPLALANALAGERLADRDPDGTRVDDASLVFNGQLDAGRDNCLQGLRWYYGLDGQPADDELDFVKTAVHEMIHGLGFQTLVALEDTEDVEIGEFPILSDGRRYPDIYSTFIRDLSIRGQPLWPELDVDQRAASIDNGPSVVWASSNTSNAAGGYLTRGLRQGRVRIYAPDDINPGSSISHWSNALLPDQIMEPFEAPETSVLSGLGLASCALQDLGWRLSGQTRCPDRDSDTFAGASEGRIVTDDDRASATVEDDGGDDNDSGGGGGGCTLAPGGPLDPLWLVMVGLAGGVLVWRRRRRGMG